MTALVEPPTRVVVLGTGTGVGKTWVTRALAESLRREGASVVALKPIETGVVGSATFGDPDDSSDAGLLARASSHRPGPPPFAFPEPISPHLAAKRVGASIELERVVEYVSEHENEVTRHVTSFVLVESAGGCLSPLARGVTNADLALALEPAVWLLVAPDALGVLHDVTATLTALRARGRTPDYLVLSEARPADESTRTNAAELRALGIADPFATAARDDPATMASLARALVARRAAAPALNSRGPA